MRWHLYYYQIEIWFRTNGFTCSPRRGGDMSSIVKFRTGLQNSQYYLLAWPGIEPWTQSFVVEAFSLPLNQQAVKYSYPLKKQSTLILLILKQRVCYFCCKNNLPGLGKVPPVQHNWFRQRHFWFGVVAREVGQPSHQGGAEDVWQLFTVDAALSLLWRRWRIASAINISLYLI